MSPPGIFSSAPLGGACSPAGCPRQKLPSPVVLPSYCFWLSLAVDKLNEDPASVVHSWKETKLLRAWEREVQMEAVDKIKELFPNLSSKSRPEITAMVNQLDGGDYLPDDLVEEEEAGYMGLPFNQQESADEWIDAVNWDEIDPFKIN